LFQDVNLILAKGDKVGNNFKRFKGYYGVFEIYMTIERQYGSFSGQAYYQFSLFCQRTCILSLRRLNLVDLVKEWAKTEEERERS